MHPSRLLSMRHRDQMLDLVGHVSAALIQSDRIAAAVVIEHLQWAHRLALDLYSSSVGTCRDMRT